MRAKSHIGDAISTADMAVAGAHQILGTTVTTGVTANRLNHYVARSIEGAPILLLHVLDCVSHEILTLILLTDMASGVPKWNDC